MIRQSLGVLRFMARRKSKDPILQDAKSEQEIDDLVSIPPDDTAPLTSKSEAAKLRLVSVKQCAMLLNRDRNTIQKWLDQGCPFVTKADRDRGIAWELDIADVVKWLEERAAKSVAEKFGDPNDKTSKEEGDRRKAVAAAVMAELDMLERLKSVVPVSSVLELWSKDYNEVRAKVMSLPDILAVNVDPSIAGAVRILADKHCRAVLDKLKTKDTILKWK
ncbi:hypothetical protein GOL99_12220 [Sinorhizobium medicae]|nr:hypothetical protein [Sinorhizobium medicae]